MGREKEGCSRTYGFPIYCAGWVPFSHISSSASASASESESASAAESSANESDKEDSSAAAAAPPAKDASEEKLLVVLGGGGGEGRSGVPNAVVVAGFDSSSRSLSEQPVFRIGTDADLPYRMALHPKGDGIICSFPKSCRWYKWDLPASRDYEKLSFSNSKEKLTQLENVGLQLSLCFNEEGSVLATGGEDGNLRVFKWPAMESILTEVVENTSIKDLNFSCDGKYLVSMRNSGPCRVWDLKSSTVIANLARERGEIFGFCRFSRSSDSDQVLFVTAMHDDQGKIITWNTTTWKRIGSKKIVKDAISAFNVSPDGKLLAVGTIEGGIVILNSKNLQVHSVVKKAHLGILTSLVFSHDSRALLSSSFDSTARVTTIEAKKSSGFNMWLALLVIIISILAYYMKSQGLL